MKCPICHFKNNKFLFIASNVHGHHFYGIQKFKFYECSQCKCIFPKININQSFYKKYYPPKYNSNSPLLEKIYSSISLFIKKRYLPQTGALLDIGCVQGQFINSLPRKITATGIDINSSHNIASNIIEADFTKYKFSQKYDIITFWHSLEHFSNPKITIKKAIKLLNDRGRIIISIPNTNSIAYRLGKINWYHLDSPRHLFLPNNNNIKKLFPKKSIIKIIYQPFEFPLDLFWSLKNYPYLRIIYPILKMFDHETMTVIYQKT
jgi:2-polyprenyl-3-methyl-5-hydroxy-6-metoxy-1,4-benzoquinol methylase